MLTHTRRRRISFVAITVLVLLSLLLFVQQAPADVSAHAGVNHADVVVQFGDGSVTVKRITFTTQSITGLEALQRTGLDLAEDNGAVCRIDGTGCPASDCFCAYPAAYWGYYRWDGSQWAFATKGAGETEVTDGDVEGWSWGRTLPEIPPEVLDAHAGLDWLRGQQLDDGSYAGFGGNTGATLDTVLAVAAANRDADDWTSDAGNSLLDYIDEHAADYATTNAASAGKLTLGLAAAGEDPRSFARLDLVVSMTNNYSPTAGTFGATNWDQAWSMLGWRAAGQSVPVTATQALAARINDDGGWGYTADGSSDVDSTGLVLQALVVGGQPITSSEVISAVAYLESVQNGDAGFPFAAGNESNTNSTALAVQGLIAVGENPLTGTWEMTGTTPADYLLDKQLASGAFAWTDPQPNQLATQQAVPALLGRPFPYLGRGVAVREALDWIAGQQQTDGSFAGFGTGATIDAVLAIKAAGDDPVGYTPSQSVQRTAAMTTPLDYLADQAASYAASSAAGAGKLAVGVVAAGGDPRDIGGVDLVVSMTEYYSPTTGAYGTSTFDQAWSMLGWRAAGEAVPVTATLRLSNTQASGGGWGFNADAGSADPDSTGLALRALAVAGAERQHPAVESGVAYLQNAQNPDGGFPGFGGDTSASSTGLALQGLAAYDEAPESLLWTTREGLKSYTPVDALLALQSTEGGFAGFSGPNDPSATYQAIPGLVGVAFPLGIEASVYLPVVAAE